MKKQFETGTTVHIAVYSKGSGSEDSLFEFEARNRGKMEMRKVTTKSHISRLLNNGYHGSELRFEGVDTQTKRFFRQCAGIQ